MAFLLLLLSPDDADSPQSPRRPLAHVYSHSQVPIETTNLLLTEAEPGRQAQYGCESGQEPRTPQEGRDMEHIATRCADGVHAVRGIPAADKTQVFRAGIRAVLAFTADS